MRTDNIHDSTRYVVSDEHHGNILPGKRIEMWRDVYLKSGAYIKGGIWCGSLSCIGSNICVENAVYCRGAATIKGDLSNSNSKENVTFKSCFSTPDSLIIEKTPYKVRFLSDLYISKINISNSFIYGNLYANHAIIQDSIILGGVFCQGVLKLNNSIVSTFEANRAILGEGVSVIFPFAIGKEEINLSNPITFLTFYNIFKNDDDQGEAILADDEDIFQISLQVDKNKDDDSNNELINCISISEKILDCKLYFNNLLSNRQFIQYLSLGRSIDPNNSFSHTQNELVNIESNIWQILKSGVKITSDKKTSKIDELINRFKSII